MESREAEFVVVPGSPLIGKTFGDVEKKFGVKINHYHNPKPAVSTRKIPQPTEIIKPYWTLKAFGPFEEIKELRLFSTRF